MAYKQHEWVNGEIITAEKLNNIESGIAETDTREIEASATATVENTAGEPSCNVTATGSTSSIAFKFAFKGIKGEAGSAPILRKGEEAIQVSYDNGETWSDLFPLDDIKGEKGADGGKGEAAPTVVSQEINITGTVISGTTYYSDGSTSPITGVYTAEGDNSDSETEPEGGGDEVEGESDEGDNGATGDNGGDPDSGDEEDAPDEGEGDPDPADDGNESDSGNEEGGETPADGEAEGGETEPEGEQEGGESETPDEGEAESPADEESPEPEGDNGGDEGNPDEGDNGESETPDEGDAGGDETPADSESEPEGGNEGDTGESE